MASLRSILSTLSVALLMAIPAMAVTAPAVQPADDIKISEFTIAHDTWCEIRDRWIEEILATHPEGTWAELKWTPSDEDLAKLGLPSAEILARQRYPQPTMVGQDGTLTPVTLPLNLAVASFAGTGCMGIRPGALLLLIDQNGIGWCSMAHVYGSPGNYDISTAGHCGKTGTIATVIAGVGNHNGVLQPILLDFGKFRSSSDGGPGRDWALIDIYSEFQHLVSPTMCFWGGPLGMYTKTGSNVAVSFPRNGLVPQATVNPDPLLAQPIVHYGHGAGVGTGGTPRVGFAQHWAPTYYTFFGAISPGDSGSGANALGDLDSPTDVNEAAGIMTHLWVDPLMRHGVGIMLGTRATQVNGQLAHGFPVAIPVPVAGL